MEEQSSQQQTHDALEALAAAMQTAASAYARALNTELEIKSDGE